jgi:hypothetical protein
MRSTVIYKAIYIISCLYDLETVSIRVGSSRRGLADTRVVASYDGFFRRINFDKFVLDDNYNSF